jgi:photosystem II stability/assembly factor-like uncharacterized protein
VDFLNDKEGFAVGGGGTILRTQNGGQNWQAVQSPVAQALKRVDFVNERAGWIVGFNGTVLTTFDAGASWTSLDLKTKQKLYGLFIDRKYGYAVGENGVFAQYLP